MKKKSFWCKLGFHKVSQLTRPRIERMVGTGMFLDGKEIMQRKIYISDYEEGICLRCGELVKYYDMEDSLF